MVGGCIQLYGRFTYIYHWLLRWIRLGEKNPTNRLHTSDLPQQKSATGKGEGLVTGTPDPTPPEIQQVAPE